MTYVPPKSMGVPMPWDCQAKTVPSASKTNTFSILVSLSLGIGTSLSLSVFPNGLGSFSTVPKLPTLILKHLLELVFNTGFCVEGCTQPELFNRNFLQEMLHLLVLLNLRVCSIPWCWRGQRTYEAN